MRGRDQRSLAGKYLKKYAQVYRECSPEPLIGGPLSRQLLLVHDLSDWHSQLLQQKKLRRCL